MSNKTRKCVVCGTEFEYCPRSCREAKNRWRFIYCGDNCHDIFNIITNVYDIQGVGAAVDQLLDCDLSNMDNFRDDVKRKIDLIFDEANISLDNSDDEEFTIDDDSSVDEDEVTADEFNHPEDYDTDFMSDSVDE